MNRWWWKWTMLNRCDECGAWPLRMTYVKGYHTNMGGWIGLWACLSCYRSGDGVGGPWKANP